MHLTLTRKEFNKDERFRKKIMMKKMYYKVSIICEKDTEKEPTLKEKATFGSTCYISVMQLEAALKESMKKTYGIDIRMDDLRLEDIEEK